MNPREAKLVRWLCMGTATVIIMFSAIFIGWGAWFGFVLVILGALAGIAVPYERDRSGE